jgi:hypothetical protein
MIKIETPDLRSTQRKLTFLERVALPAARRQATYEMGVEVANNERRVMRARFDRPVPFTLNSLFVKQQSDKYGESATKVWFKDRAVKGTAANDYLQAEVYGGQRNYKNFEGLLLARRFLKRGKYIVPAEGAQLDGFGNVKRGQISRIISALQIGKDGSQFASDSRRSKRKGNAKKYFWATIEGTEGVWERRVSGLGVGVRPIFIVADRNPRYKIRLPFERIAVNTIKAHYPRIFTKVLAEAVERASRQ